MEQYLPLILGKILIDSYTQLRLCHDVKDGSKQVLLKIQAIFKWSR